MADTKEIKEMAEKASDLAKNIWLAGLGAYGKALDEAHCQYEKVSEKVNKESTRLFDELVAKGKKLEGETQVKFNEVKEKSSATLEERLAQVKDSMNFTSKNADVASQLEELSSKLDLVLEALGAKTTAKKVVTAKKSAASAAKAS
jgi:hypothetical protein